MRLDQADWIMLGDREVSRVYLGANLVWGNVFSPASLFAQGEPGVWYDPSDFSTMFQDAAGAVPVTAVEQPVGLMLDKSGRGNHAYQPTTTSRPVLSARVNLLTKTEQFNDGVWSKNNATVTANAGVAPNGTTTADLITPATGTALTGVDQYYNNTVSAAHTLSVYVKANGANFVQLLWNAGLSYNFANFDLSTGAVTAGVYTNATITSQGNGWFRCTITSTLAIAFQRVYISVVPTANSSRAAAYTGDGTSGIYIWGASLVPADQADIPYQRVNTATDYDTQGFPHYLRFDGVDDRLVTAGIVWSAACDCFTAIRHTGGAPWVDVWLTSNSGNGYWAVGQSGSSSSPNQPEVGSPAYFVDGTALNPVTRGEIYTRCINQTRIVETRSLNLMANAGGLSIGGYTNFLLNGRLYGLVIAEGVTDAEASSVRRWLAGKAGVAL